MSQPVTAPVASPARAGFSSRMRSEVNRHTALHHGLEIVRVRNVIEHTVNHNRRSAGREPSHSHAQRRRHYSEPVRLLQVKCARRVIVGRAAHDYWLRALGHLRNDNPDGRRSNRVKTTRHRTEEDPVIIIIANAIDRNLHVPNWQRIDGKTGTIASPVKGLTPLPLDIQPPPFSY